MRQEMENAVAVEKQQMLLTNSLNGISLDDGNNCMEKKITKRDMAMQTDNLQISMIIRQLVQERIDQMQPFDSHMLQENIKRVEDENKNLKKRETILLKRLVTLEEDSKKRGLPNKSDLESGNKKQKTLLPETVDIKASVPQGDKVATDETAENDFCPPLFRPAQKKTSAISCQRELPTQMVTPIQIAAQKEAQGIVQKNGSVVHPGSTRIISEPQVVRQTVPYSQNDRQSRESMNGRSHQIPIPLSQSSVHYRPLGQYQGQQPRSIVQEQGLRQRPPPNLNLFKYRPLSKIAPAPRMIAYQVRGTNGPQPQQQLHLQQQTLQTVRYATVPSQPPPPYQDPVGYNPLPQLTASITSDSNSIILTWDCFNASKQFQRNADAYLLFAYHTLNLSKPPPPNLAAWKRIGAIKALPLPIACTLTQSFDGHNYFFAVVPVDNQGRMGELSNPCALKVAL